MVNGDALGLSCFDVVGRPDKDDLGLVADNLDDGLVDGYGKLLISRVFARELEEERRLVVLKELVSNYL